MPQSDKNWTEEFWLYRIQIYSYDEDKRQTYWLVAQDMDFAIKYAKEYFGDNAELCGAWEMKGLILTQIKEVDYASR